MIGSIDIIMKSVRPSVTLCIVALMVRVMWKVKSCAVVFLAGNFLFTSSEFCCRTYRSKKRTAEIASESGYSGILLTELLVCRFQPFHSSMTTVFREKPSNRPKLIYQ